MSLHLDQRNRIKEILEQNRKKIETDLIEIKKNAQPVSLEESIGRLSRMDALQQQQMAANAKRRAEQSLGAIRAALSRLNTEDFGVCMECGVDIDFERLLKRPESVFCIECQSRRD